jgi:nicotinamidase-related amidase
MDGIPKRSEVALVVIDVQEKFRPAIFEFDRVLDNCSKLIKAFKVFKLPIIRTEQYSKGLGCTVPELQKLMDGNAIEKMEFSCFDNAEFKHKVNGSHMRGLVICGIEAHVCVLKTALDALKEGLEVYLVADAISSRKESDYKTAIDRVAQSGAYKVSTEMIIFQLMEKAGTDEFKEIQKIVK